MVEIKGFLIFFACLRNDPDPYKIIIITYPDLRGPKTHRSGSITLPDGLSNNNQQEGTRKLKGKKKCSSSEAV
jgi:hypothetical protein